jgi:chlorite dismutase
MDNSEKKSPTFTMFMLVKTTNTWLKLEPKERFGFLDKTIQPILKNHPTVKMRFYDSEAFSGKASDIIVWETDDLRSYQHLVEELRESDFWGTYFEVLDIIPTIENAYAEYYKVEAY